MVIMLQTWDGTVGTKTTRKMKTNVAIVKKPFEIEGDESYDVGSEAIILTAFNTKKEYAVASDMGWYVRVPKEYFEDGLKESWGYLGKNTRWAI